MKIVIRTSSYSRALPSIISFIQHYPKLLPFLTIQFHENGPPIFSNNEAQHLKELQSVIASTYSDTFTLDFISHENIPWENYWAYLLFQAMKDANYNKPIISIDDDVIFLKDGLFTYLHNTSIRENKPILGYQHLQASGKSFLHSALTYVRRPIKDTDFAWTTQETTEWIEGCDAGLIGQHYSEEVMILTDGVTFPNRKAGVASSFITEHVYHIGGLSSRFNIAVVDSFIEKQDTDTVWYKEYSKA